MIILCLDMYSKWTVDFRWVGHDFGIEALGVLWLGLGNANQEEQEIEDNSTSESSRFALSDRVARCLVIATSISVGLT